MMTQYPHLEQYGKVPEHETIDSYEKRLQASIDHYLEKDKKDPRAFMKGCL